MSGQAYKQQWLYKHKKSSASFCLLLTFLSALNTLLCPSLPSHWSSPPCCTPPSSWASPVVPANPSSSHSPCISPCAQLHKTSSSSPSSSANPSSSHSLCTSSYTQAVPIASVLHHEPKYIIIIITIIIICVIISKPEQFPQPVYFTIRPTTQTSPSSSSVSSSANWSRSHCQRTSSYAQLRKHHHLHRCCCQLSSPSGQRYSCSQCTMCPTTQAMKGFLINIIISVITIISIKNLNQTKLWRCQVTGNERNKLFFCIPKIPLCSARPRTTNHCFKGWTGERSLWSTATVLCSSWPTPSDDLQLLYCAHHDPHQLTVLLAEDEEEVSNQILDLSHRWRQQLTQPAHHPKVRHHPGELSDVLFQATQTLAFEKHQGRTGKGSCMSSGLRKGGNNNKKTGCFTCFHAPPCYQGNVGAILRKMAQWVWAFIYRCCVLLPSSPSPPPPHNHLLCSVTLLTSPLPLPQSPVV